MATPIEEKGKEKKQSKGRKKIEIKKIDHEGRRQVTFSKRRVGLFKKASEISILCGVEAAVIVTSPKERVYTFGHPDVDSIVDRFVRFSGCEGDQEGFNSNAMKTCLEEIKTLEVEKRRLEEVMNLVGKKRDDMFWWMKDANKMGLQELEDFVDELDGLQKMVEMKVSEHDKAKSFSGL